jgi:hypothetical protein
MLPPSQLKTGYLFYSQFCAWPIFFTYPYFDPRTINLPPPACAGGGLLLRRWLLLVKKNPAGSWRRRRLGHCMELPRFFLTYLSLAYIVLHTYIVVLDHN